MKLLTIGSGSSGNAYAITNMRQTLLLECGIRIDKVLKDIEYSTVVGCLLTHSHGDHSKYVKEYLRRGINVYTSATTAEELDISDSAWYKEISIFNEFNVGDFGVLPIPVQHDVQCTGYVITHEDFGNLLFITDTNNLDYKFAFDINYLMIECNYSEEILNQNILENKIDYSLAKRIKETHLSLEKLIRFLADEKIRRNMYEIILIHTSEYNAKLKAFLHEIIKHTGKITKSVKIDSEINLNVEII